MRVLHNSGDTTRLFGCRIAYDTALSGVLESVLYCTVCIYVNGPSHPVIWSSDNGSCHARGEGPVYDEHNRRVDTC